MINNLEKDITPNELAQEMATSIRQLQRTFKDELSITPNTFITTIKMEEAAILLKAKEMNISEVAYAVGFSDPAYFTKVFKKYFNQNPKHYIKG